MKKTTKLKFDFKSFSGKNNAIEHEQQVLYVKSLNLTSIKLFTIKFLILHKMQTIYRRFFFYHTGQFSPPWLLKGLGGTASSCRAAPPPASPQALTGLLKKNNIYLLSFHSTYTI